MAIPRHKRIQVPEFVEYDNAVRAELRARVIPELQADLDQRQASREGSGWLAFALGALGLGGLFAASR